MFATRNDAGAGDMRTQNWEIVNMTLNVRPWHATRRTSCTCKDVTTIKDVLKVGFYVVEIPR